MAEWKHAHLNQIGAAGNETVLYTEFKDKIGILTAKLTTPYLITFGNVSKGPVVVEMPVGNTAGMMSMNISFAKRFPNSYYRDDAVGVATASGIIRSLGTSAPGPEANARPGHHRLAGMARQRLDADVVVPARRGDHRNVMVAMAK